MLNGLRRVAIVGGSSTFHRLIRGAFDRRVELRFLPAGTDRTRAEAEQDVTRTDAVVLWNVGVDEAARRIYETSRCLVIEVKDADLTALGASVAAALQPD